MAEKKKKRTKHIATFVHPCDDFVVTDDEGNEYYPHAGETVTFRRDLPFGLMRLHDEMTGLEWSSALLDILVRQIMDWDWTDDYEEPYPNPKDDPKGFIRAIIDLSPGELIYLRDTCWQPANLGEAKSSES